MPLVYLCIQENSKQEPNWALNLPLYITKLRGLQAESGKKLLFGGETSKELYPIFSVNLHPSTSDETAIEDVAGSLAINNDAKDGVDTSAEPSGAPIPLIL